MHMGVLEESLLMTPTKHIQVESQPLLPSVVVFSEILVASIRVMLESLHSRFANLYIFKGQWMNISPGSPVWSFQRIFSSDIVEQLHNFGSVHPLYLFFQLRFLEMCAQSSSQNIIELVLYAVAMQVLSYVWCWARIRIVGKCFFR